MFFLFPEWGGQPTDTEPGDYQYVKYIEAKDFSAVQLCGFEDQFGAGIPTSLQVDYETGKQYVVLDKEQIVYSVYCDGTCPLVNGTFLPPIHRGAQGYAPLENSANAVWIKNKKRQLLYRQRRESLLYRIL